MSIHFRIPTVRVKALRRQRSSAFTVVELLIVVVVIAIIAAISIVAFTGVQQRARDSVRKQDISAIIKAIHMYSNDVGDFADSGCGNGSGSGWLVSDYDGTGPNVPINDCILGKGPHTTQNYLGTARRDPSGATTSPGAYMKASCGTTGTFLMAKLETLPQDATATDGTCYSTWDSSYGINYVIRL